MTIFYKDSYAASASEQNENQNYMDQKMLQK